MIWILKTISTYRLNVTDFNNNVNNIIEHIIIDANNSVNKVVILNTIIYKLLQKSIFWYSSKNRIW